MTKIYSLRKPIRHIEYLGKIEDIARLRFLCSSVKANSRSAQFFANTHSNFLHIPKLAVLGEWQDNMPVFRYIGKKPWTYQKPNMEVYRVGELNIKQMKVKLSESVELPLKWAEIGNVFTMGETLLYSFNSLVVQNDWTPSLYRKGVTSYSKNDLFEMRATEFIIQKNGMLHRYRLVDLPAYWLNFGVTMQVNLTNGLMA